jgi:hypothetical protein
MAGIQAVPPVTVSRWVGARGKGNAGGGRDGATRFQQQNGVKIVLMAAERRWGIFARIDNRSWHWTHEASGSPSCCMARSDVLS